LLREPGGRPAGFPDWPFWNWPELVKTGVWGTDMTASL
jgi:hypothetical protein